MFEVFKRDTLLWLAAATAVGLTAVAGSFNVQRMRNTEQEVRAKHETLAALHGLLSDLTVAESAHRGYLLTGQADFLDPLRASESRVRERLAALDAQWADDPGKHDRLGPLTRLAAGKFDEMRQTHDLRDRNGLQKAAEVVSAGEGKRIMDRLRAECEAAERQEQADLRALGATAHQQYQTAEGTNLAGAAVAVIVLGVAGVLLRRDAKRREKAAAVLAAEKAATERALAQLDALVRNAPYSIAFLDHDLRPVRVNEAFAQTTRIAVEDHFGRRLPELLPDIPSELVSQYHEVLDGGPSVIGRLVFADGRVWEVSAFQVPLADDDLGLGVIGQDVTDRHRAEERLRESEGRFRQLAEAMPQIVWVTRPDGYHEYYNARWYEFTGLTAEQSIGWGWSGPLHPDDAERSKARWQQSTDTGEPYEIEYRFRRHDGVYEWFLGRAVAVRDDAGRIVRWLGTCTGIDEQVRTAQELHEARRFTESVLHSLPGHLAVIEADGRVLTVNESWRQFGVANGVPAGFDWTTANYFNTCRAEEYGARAEAGIRAVASGERGAFEMEYPCHGGGVERYFVLRANRFRGDGPVRLVVTHENVTERVVAERQVREAASQLAQLTEGVPLLMWASRPTGEYDYLSRQWLDYTGEPLVPQLGSGWLQAVHPDDREPTADAWRRAVDAGGGYDVEFRLRRHDGAYRWFAVRGIPLRDQGGTVVRWFGSCTDIDDRVRQEGILERLVEERTLALLRSNEELEKFAYIASHDLQEPLRKIQAFGTRLADKFRPAVGEQGKDYIDRMLDSAGRMRRLIEDLLAFSRVTTKAVTFVPVDLNAVARDVLSDLDDRLTRSGGRVEVGPLPTLPGDPSQLRQVFQNLIGNALKFAKPDVVPVVRVTAVPFTHLPADDPPPGDGWRITVADNGIGFDPQYAGRIFELFQRLHGRGEYEGTGLGLAIVRKIVDRHGATITAHSHPGSGAEFRIDWPLPSAADAPPSASPNGDHL